MKTAASSSKQLREQRGNGGCMKKKSIVKRVLGISVLALVSSWVVLVSAAPTVIDIEPEQCQIRCYYVGPWPVYCYEICY
jgi:hypothetical protein